MTRSKLPLKTILFSFLVILSAKKSSNDDAGWSGESGPLALNDEMQVSAPNKSTPILAELGVLLARNSSDSNSTYEFCIFHYNSNDLPGTDENITYYTLLDSSLHPKELSDLCVLNDVRDNDALLLNNTIVLLEYDSIGRCNLTERALDLQKRGASGLLIQFPMTHKLKEIRIENGTLDPSFIVAVMHEKSIEALKRTFSIDIHDPIPSTIQIAAFSPHTRPNTSYSFDLSLLVIWFIATGTLVIGCYWSGLVRYSLFERKRREFTRSLHNTHQGDDDSSLGQKKQAQNDEEQFLSISPVHVVIFVGCMAAMLVALYAFFTYLVYFIMGLFVMATTLSVCVCCDPIARWILPAQLIAIKIPCFSKRYRVPLYQLLILAFATSLSLTWFFSRKKSYSWIFQDILGVFFSINMLRTIRLPSFKICTFLLTLLFFYDIFFVFITPLILPSGQSIMVEVATGGSQKEDTSTSSGGGSDDDRERLPMVLKVPHLSIARANQSDPLEVCYADFRKLSHSVLGFGDILVPGLLVSYCHAFDLIHHIRGRPYFVTTAIAYALGLIVTFVGLHLMSGVAQPALLYLVPMTLIPPAIIAYYRGEFTALWNGPGDGSQPHDQDDDEDDEESAAINRSTESSSNSSSPTSHTVNANTTVQTTSLPSPDETQFAPKL